jgi:predicted metal-dependent enzyme (double-stranded beta helix superfamily)
MNPDASAVLHELGLPSDRTLERPELERLATALAERPDLWTPHLDANATERTYACLHRDAQLDIWAIFWLPENDTGWHDHDTSSGAVHVVGGELEEHALLVAAPERRTRYGAGAAFTFGPSHIHRLTCSSPHAVSIHAYSPPLWRMGAYAIEADGTIRRISISYAEELRPVDDVAA